MRKATVITVAVAAALGLGIYIAVANPFSPDRNQINELSRKWMEDLQFKDFRSSSLYHHKLDRDRVDIGRALERLFLVKPEMLDILDYKIVKAQVDSSGKRARVKVNVRYKKLNKDKKPKEARMMLYWMKRHPDCPIGGRCPDDTCVNEFGEPIKKSDDEGPDHGSPRNAPEPAKSNDDTYSCNSAAERQWYMNLDSTLKEKAYARD
jgi:hypothetical protein